MNERLYAAQLRSAVSAKEGEIKMSEMHRDLLQEDDAPRRAELDILIADGYAELDRLRASLAASEARIAAGAR